MKNKKIVFVVAAFVLAVGVGLLAGFYVAPQRIGFERSYYGVLLENGNFYVGRLNRFPAFWRMTDALLLQTVADPANPEQAAFSLIPVREGSIWSPESLFISPQSIVLWGRVGEDSEVMRVIRDPAAAAPLPPFSPQAAPTPL